MKTLTVILARPPLMAAHGLILLAGNPAVADELALGADAVARAMGACTGPDQAARIREALPNVGPAARAALLADPLGQMHTFGIALVLDPAQKQAYDQRPTGPCRFTVGIGGLSQPEAAFEALAGYTGRSTPIGPDLIDALDAALAAGGVTEATRTQVNRLLDKSVGQIATLVADLDRIAPAEMPLAA